MNLEVRELEKGDIKQIADYWTKSDESYMRGMGVDTSKLPALSEWEEMLTKQLSQKYAEKQSYCTIWTVDGKAVGHSNVNKIVFGEEASMHLHIWNPEDRGKGYGRLFLPQSIKLYFENLDLKTIYCEPAAFNSPPNRTLPHLGFELEKTYSTIPGFICFEQPVNRWVLSKEKFLSQFNSR